MTRKYPSARTTLSVSALTFLLTSALLYAGPLNPPVGPVAPTLKTLTEVEPRIAINATNTPGDADSLFKITQPGSYYLTGNITGVVGKHGIEIASSGVTLDLNGFDLLGVPLSLDGVRCTVNFRTSIEVRNGSIRLWGGDGLDLLSNTVRGSVVSGIRANLNGGTGIGVGNSSTATYCEPHDNVGDGILTGHGCTITTCTASSNAGAGLGTSTGCTVTDCAFHQNTSDGIQLGDGSSVKNCTATENGGSGILAANGCTVADCTTRANMIDGISTGFSCTVTKCSASSNTGSGINTESSCTVSNCAASSNNGDGIVADDGSQVIDNHAAGNSGDGIQATSFCMVRGNDCYSNRTSVPDGAGIHITGIYNRIEANTCTRNDRGIDVDAQANIILRNTCGFNSSGSWSIAANNNLAPIVFVPSNSPAINGSSYSGNLGSTDANANYTLQ
jgi:hypothetical protein